MAKKSKIFYGKSNNKSAEIDSIYIGPYNANNINNWKHEVWDLFKGTDNIYHKDKTLDNCWEKYGLLENKEWYGVNVPVLKANNDLEVPILSEFDKEDNNDGFLYESHVITDGSKFVRFNNRGYPDNESTRLLFSKINQYLRNHTITYECANLFGYPNTFSPHWSWSMHLQQLYGQDNWVVNVGMRSPMEVYAGSDIYQNGINLTAMFANTNAKNIEFVFKGKAVTKLDNLFSSLRTASFGNFNITVRYENPFGQENVVNNHPYYDHNSNRSNGFVPTNFIKVFRAAQISQEGLTNFLSNTIWDYCRDFNGAFEDGLRVSCHTVTPAYGCQKWEETPSNTWKPNYSLITDGNFGKNTIGRVDPQRITIGGLLYTFKDSAIEEVDVIIDMTYCYSFLDNPSENNFKEFLNTWRQTEGVKYMKRIRLKNVGNADFDFDYGDSNKLNGRHFDNDSINYLLDNIRDHSYYVKDQERYTKCLRPIQRLTVPESWLEQVTGDRLRELLYKGWEVKIGNEIRHSLVAVRRNLDIVGDGSEAPYETVSEKLTYLRKLNDDVNVGTIENLVYDLDMVVIYDENYTLKKDNLYEINNNFFNGRNKSIINTLVLDVIENRVNNEIIYYRKFNSTQEEPSSKLINIEVPADKIVDLNYSYSSYVTRLSENHVCTINNSSDKRMIESINLILNETLPSRFKLDRCSIFLANKLSNKWELVDMLTYYYENDVHLNDDGDNNYRIELNKTMSSRYYEIMQDEFDLSNYKIRVELDISNRGLISGSQLFKYYKYIFEVSYDASNVYTAEYAGILEIG